MVVRGLLQKTINLLKEYNVDNAVFEANLIVRTVLGLSPIDVVLSYNKTVDRHCVELAEEYAKRRSFSEPLQYILGVQEFMGLEFLVNENVLIPRSDTETLVEAVIEQQSGMNVLDICTGSGCIALSIAHFNKNAYVLGIDISREALLVAEKNADKLNLSNRVRFEKKDILREIPYGVYNVIVSNPPYIESDEINTLQDDVRLYEPRIALDGGKDGLDFYRRIIDISPELLSDKGILYLEVGYNQSEVVKALMKKNFSDINTIKDLSGIN